MTPTLDRRVGLWLVTAAWLISAAFKLSWSYTIVFEYDVVPVVALGWQWLYAGGPFPVYGTLSSVAAYNLPGLVWLHLPALMVTSSPWLAMVLTLLWFNMLGTFAAYGLGREIGGELGGVAAALLFTFSASTFAAVSMSWAQLLLPTFFVGVGLCLFRWWRTGRGVWMLGAGLTALLAFMTHFSAVLLLPVMIVFWLLSGAVVRWRWLLLTAALALALLAPYMAFQAQRDFRDLQAFLTRRVPIPSEISEDIRARVRQLVREQSVDVPSPPSVSAPSSSEAPTVNEPQSRLERFIRRLPYEIWVVASFQTQFILGSFEAIAVLRLLLFATSAAALVIVARRVLRRQPRRTWWQGWAGSAVLLLTLPASLTVGMIVLRVYPADNTTYLEGIQGWLIALTGAAVGIVGQRWRRLRLPLLAAVIAMCALSAFNQHQRLEARRSLQFPQAWYYTTLQTLAATIAEGVPRGGTVSVGYALWPQQRTFDWVPVWSLVDSRYRLGMALDFVLLAEHGVTNLNQDPYGIAEDPQFIVKFAQDVRPDEAPRLVVNGMALIDVR
jgi:hypothetical protein